MIILKVNENKGCIDTYLEVSVVIAPLAINEGEIY